MIRLGVIGLGTIFEKQKIALELLAQEEKGKRIGTTLCQDGFVLSAVCDEKPERLAVWQEAQKDGGPRCHEDFRGLLEEEVDAVLIATPPKTHFKLAEACLNAGKHVLLEKPAVLSMEELTTLYKIAEVNHVLFHVAYHAAYALDLLWFLKNKEKLINEYQFGSLSEIHCSFFDPYMQEGKIVPQGRNLCGSLMDSGVNALSVCERLVDLSSMHLCRKEEKREEETDPSTTYASRQIYEGSLQILVETGWDRGINQKETLLSFSDSCDRILLDHSNQRVLLLRTDGQKLLYEETKVERLAAQYVGVFRDFECAVLTKKQNEMETLQIHRLLLA